MIVPWQLAQFMEASYNEPAIIPAGQVVMASKTRVGILFGCFDGSSVSIRPTVSPTGGEGFNLSDDGQSTLRIGFLEHGPLVFMAWQGVGNAGAGAMAVSEISLPEKYWPFLRGERPFSEIPLVAKE